MKVSVIIPVYNGERYLRECLDSVVAQTLQDIEIICVNDGSTDNSLKILEEYAQKDNRMIVLSQENKTAGAARNKGIEIARGEYFSFLDADDFFESDMLEKAYVAAKGYQAEIVVYRSNRYDEKRGMFTGSDWTVREELLPNKEIFSHKDMQDVFYAFMSWAWDKLFDADFIRKTNLRFQEQQSINDLYFVHSAMARAEKIHFLDEHLVHKRVNNTSALTTQYVASARWKNFLNALLALKQQLLEWNIYSELRQDFVNYALRLLVWNLDQYLESDICAEFYENVQREYAEKLDLIGHPRGYFWRENDYNQLIDMQRKSYKEYRWTRRLTQKNGTYLFPFELVDRGSRIVLYGAGVAGIEYYRQVKYSGYCKLVAWVDKNFRDKGAEVQSPEILSGLEFDQIVIAVNEEKTAKAISKELQQGNVPQEKILWRQAEIELD